MCSGRVSCFLKQRIAVKQLALHIDTWVHFKRSCFLKLHGQLELGTCARSKYAMQTYSTTIGTCNAVKTEAIGGGAVENEPSVYSCMGEPMAMKGC